MQYHTNSHRSRRRFPAAQHIQSLEQRLLMSYSVTPNSAVVMNTSLGEVAVQLYTDGTEDTTVANFLNYVNSGEYNGTFFHRATSPNDANNDQYAIVQGGGYSASAPGTPIANITDPSTGIVNEYTDAHPNTAGTIAMARSSPLDSATSQFFFNISDNSSMFNSSNPYAVFGDVIRGQGVLLTIDDLGTQNLSSTYSNGDLATVPETRAGNLVTINTATEEDTMTVTIGPNDAAGDRTVTFVDPTTNAVTKISINNADATLTFTGTSLAAQEKGHNLTITGTNLELQEVASNDSTAKSTLKINASHGQGSPTIGGIDIGGSINAIVAPKINLSGDIDVKGGIKSLSLESTTAAGVINLDASTVSGAAATTIKIPNLADVTIQSNGTIKQLIARQFAITDATYRGLGADTLSNIKIAGDFDVEVRTNNLGSFKAGALNSVLQAETIGSVNVQSINNGVIYSAAAFSNQSVGIGKVKVQGAISNAYIVAVGNIGPISAASVTGSAIMAGINTSSLVTNAFPSTLSSNATLQSIVLKKPKGASSTSFSDSQIAAYQINTLKLGAISTTSTSGTTTGVQAHDIGYLAAQTDKTHSFRFTNLDSQATVDADISQDHLVLGDFTIDMV